MKHSLALLALLLLVASPCYAQESPATTADTPAATVAPTAPKKAASKKHGVKKHAGTKTHKKAITKPAHKINTLKAPHARSILGKADPNVSEPSEMISAIKNRAQDQFWAGKRPYPQQLKETNNPPTAPVFTGAIAQRELQRGELQKNNVSPGASPDEATRAPTLRRVSFSELSGVTFDDQPLQMNASEAFRRSLDTVSFELGRPCKNQEYFGWPLQQGEQGRVDRIFESVNEKFKLRGYGLNPRKPRSVGSDVSAFTADRPDKKILGIWSAGDVGLLLLICDAEVAPEVVPAAKPETPVVTKKRKVKKKSVKPAATAKTSDAMIAPSDPPSDPNVGTPPAPAVEAKPEVIPGAPPKSLPPEPNQSTPQATPQAAPAPEPTPVGPAPATANPPAAFIPADVPIPPATPATQEPAPSVAPEPTNATKP
ncbi:MAG: hypothetical protein EB059_04290 [Alphaproteobacteria bacterium]|nr:hypothetical protein [Alphaproteobacteria bacterium]